MVRSQWPIRLLNPCFGRYNPFHPDFLADPYRAYRRLRESAPVYRHPVLRVWFLSRHADCQAVLRDPRFSVDRSRVKAPPGMNPARSLSPDFVEAIQCSLLMLDPPGHTRIRHLVNKAFTLRAVERLRPRLETLVEELLDRVEPAGEMEFVRDFASPLPVTVIAELLGVPEEDRGPLKRWSDDLTALLDPFHAPGGLAGAQRAFQGAQRSFAKLFAERRRAPRDDLLSALVSAEERGDVLSEAELLSVCMLILGAGHETTTNLLGNAMLALLAHPQERERLDADPSLIKTAVEELLRFDSPVQATDRVALEDLEIDGHAIRGGQLVVTLLGSANRDPERFPDPDRLDLGRGDNAHLAFGLGTHFCLGAQLARLEAQVALPALLRRFPDLSGPSEPPARVPSMLLRGPSALPLRLR